MLDRAAFSLSGQASTSGRGHGVVPAGGRRGRTDAHRLNEHVLLALLQRQASTRGRILAHAEVWPGVAEPSRPQPLQRPGTAAAGEPRQPMMQKPARVSAPKLMHRIKRTTTWQQLQHVVDEDGQHFNFIHLSASILHLAHLLQAAGSVPKPDWHAMAQSRQAKARQAQQQQQEGQLGGVNSSGSSTPSNSGAAITGLPPVAPPPTTSLIQPRGAHDLLRKLLSQTQLQLQMESFDVRGISNIVYALAVLRHHDHVLLGNLLSAVQYRLDTGTPQNLANIIWACVTLHFTPDREWIGLYYDALDARIPEFAPQDLANTLWAFGRLQFNGTQYKVAPDIVSRLLQQAYMQLPGFSAQHLSNSLWGLARLGFAPSPAWAQAFLAASESRMQALQPEELVSLVWAAAKLRMTPSKAWLDTVTDVSQPWLPTLTAQQLSQLTVSLGALGATPPSPWLARVLVSSLRSVSMYEPRSMVSLLSGVAKMGGPSAAGLTQQQAAQWEQAWLQAAYDMLGTPAAALQPAGSTTHTAQASWVSSASASSLQAMSQSSASHASPLQQPSQAAPGGSILGTTVPGVAQPLGTQPQPATVSAVSSSSNGRQPVNGAGAKPASSTSSLCQFTAVELAQLLHALALLHIQPSAAWLQRVLSALQSTPGMLQALSQAGSTTAMTMWALEKLTQERQAPLQPAGSNTGSNRGGPQGSSSLQGSSGDNTMSNGSSDVSSGSGSSISSNGRLLHSSSSSQQQGSAGNSSSSSSEGAGAGLEWPTSLGQGAGQGAVQVSREAGQRRRMLLPRSFLEQVATLSAPHLRPRYGLMEMATLLRSFSHLGYLPSRTWMARFWWRSLVLLDTRDRRHYKGGLRRIEPAALLLTLDALVEMQQRPHPTWWKAACTAIRSTLHRFSAHQFAGVARCMAQLGHRPPRAWLREFLLATYRSWDRFTPAEWCELVWGLGKMEAKVPIEWLARFYSTTAKQLKHLSPEQLAYITWAVGQMPVRPDPIWGAALLKATKPAMAAMTPRQLLRLLWAVNRVARVPGPTWVAAAVSAARSHAGRWQPAEEQMAAIALQMLRTRLTAVLSKRQAAKAGVGVVLAGSSATAGKAVAASSSRRGGGSGTSSGRVALSLSPGLSKRTGSGRQQRKKRRRRRKQQQASATQQGHQPGEGPGQASREGQAGAPAAAGAAVDQHLTPGLQGVSQHVESAAAFDLQGPTISTAVPGHSNSIGSAAAQELMQADAVVESALTAADRDLLQRLEAAASSKAGSSSSRGAREVVKQAGLLQ